MLKIHSLNPVQCSLPTISMPFMGISPQNINITSHRQHQNIERSPLRTINLFLVTFQPIVRVWCVATVAG